MTVISEFFTRKHEWSKLKDELLEKYLKPYLEKIKQLRKEIVIVDCFAGKGKFDSGEDGSPLIILNQINSSHAKDITHVYLIEEKYGDALENNVMCHLDKCTVLKNSYQSNIQNIQNACKGRSVFLYIDPCGIKYLDFNYFRQFKKSGCVTLELLLNFNTFGFLREGCRLLSRGPLLDLSDDSVPYEEDKTNTLENMNNIANGDYWQNLLYKYYRKEALIKDIEVEFSKQYETELRGVFKYVLNIPILTKTTNIPKYRMYYGTDSIDGLFLMVDQMNKTWKNVLKVTERGQQDLFAEEKEKMISSHLKVFFQIDFKSEVERILYITPYINMRDLFVEIVHVAGIAYSCSDFRKEIRMLEDGDFISVYREEEKTTTGKISNALDFEKKNIFIERKKR
jgi:three-Cys-motif partner protein